MALEPIAFGVVALALLICALRVVTARNLVHTVLWLGLMLAMTAIVFVFLHAPFLAAIQLILYTGGVLTLMLFGVMLTHRKEGVTSIPNPSAGIVPGVLLAGGVFALITAAVQRTTDLPAAAPVNITTQALGVSFLTEHALAFEVLSILLLAAVLGAIVIARRSDPQEGVTDVPRVAPRVRVPRPAARKGEG